MAKYNGEEWIGNKYGMLSVIEPVHKTLNNGDMQWFWKVKCDCGNEKIVKPIEIIKGKIVSCGCYRKSGKQVQSVHGESRTRLHNIWCGMNDRCDPMHKDSDRYGKRGIKVCDEWKSYEKFAEWARSNGYEDGLSIERKDVNGNYCPENCEWITLGKQARNRRTTKWVEYNGERMSLAQAAELAGLPYKQVHFRIKKGWSVEKALSTPMRRGKSELHKKCDEMGLNYHSVYNRIRNGWTEDEAFSIPFSLGNNQTLRNQ